MKKRLRILLTGVFAAVTVGAFAAPAVAAN
jgi:hypothetical protein